MDEEFAIKLKTILDESSIGKVKETINKLTEELSNKAINMTPTGSNTKLTTAKLFNTKEVEQYSAHVNYINSQINDIQEKLRRADAGEEIGEDVLKLEDRLASLNEKLEKLNRKEKESGNEIAKQPKDVNKIDFSFKGLNKTIKSTILALVGIRGVYSGIRKAMSSYLGQNEELQQKLNACWYALGSLFAPILEWIISLFAKVVSLVNSLVKSLGFAGINMSKFGKNTSKSLASFDEINNISESENKINTDELFGDVKIPDKLQKILDDLKDFVSNLTITFKNVFFEWDNLNPENIAEKLGVLGGTVLGGIIGACLGGPAGFVAGAGIGAILSLGLMTSIFNNDEKLSEEELAKMIFGSVSVLSTAVAGALLAGPTGAAIAAITVTIGLTFLFSKDDEIKDYEENNKYLNGEWITEKLNSLKDKFNEMKEKSFELKDALTEALKADLPTDWSKVKEILEKDWKDIKDHAILWWGETKESVKNNWEELKQNASEKFSNMKETIISTWDKCKSVSISTWDSIKSNLKAKIDNIKNDFSTTWTNIKSNTSNVFNSIKNTLSNVWDSIWSKCRTFLNKVIGGFESMVNRVIDSINNGIVGNLMNLGAKAVNWMFGIDLPGKLSNISLPRLATGTNYVPNDMLAEIHEGEAVIPKQFNKQEFFGNSEETNELLRELISVVDTKEFRTYISQNDIGKSAVNYINKQSRILGTNLV